MDPITTKITQQLGVALDHWDVVNGRGLQSVQAAELVNLYATFCEAIQRVPIVIPNPPRADVHGAAGSLRDQVTHLAGVAQALRGFRYAGTVRADGSPLRFQGARGYGLFRVDITWPVEGWATYIHVAEREFKKAGKTGDGENFDERMNGSYNCLRKVIAGGLPYLGDPWKRHASHAILKGQEVELWAKAQPTHEVAKDEEDILNEFYRGEWSKEGWRGQIRRPTWPTALNRRRARLDGTLAGRS